MEQLYEKYVNIQLFATSHKYRNYKLLDKVFHSFDDFKNQMQIHEYVLHKFQNPKNPSKPMDLYLFKHDSKYISSTVNFKKILDRYNHAHDIIMITKTDLDVYRKKSIRQYKQLNLKNYIHKHFIMELNRGPLCSVHTILTKAQTKAVCYDTMTHVHKFPAILESDPQNVWIGGEVGELIKIEPVSELTGGIIEYKVVTPDSGKVQQTTGAIATLKKENGLADEDAALVLASDDLEDEGEDYVDDYEDIAGDEE